MTPEFDLAVAGAGPAGCAAALRAARAGARVLLLERGRYPRHKVCGEFVSAEGVALLKDLDAEAAQRLLNSAPRIARSRLFIDATQIEAPIEPVAASVTRLALDHALWQAAIRAGADARQDSPVEAVSGTGPFELKTQTGTFSARAMVVAAGRWSSLRHPKRDEGEKWLGMKAHFREPAIPASVDLYFFRDGYCGVQPVRRGQINVCAMVRAHAARSLEQVFGLHPQLEERSRRWSLATGVVTTSPLIFTTPIPERDGVLYVGDAAGFVDPFVGDGISLALRSGAKAADCLTASAANPALVYREWYERELAPVFRNASLLRRVLALPGPLRKPIVSVMQAAPVARWIVRSTR